MNGRHFILLGVIACTGLVSVHDGQEQVELCYQIGALDKELREIRSQIALCKIQHLALQSPHAVTERATELRLKVRPVTPPAVEVGEPRLPPAEVTRSLGSPQGARP
ncbi:MAG: hypothetical protein NTW87_12675, partial [Planctomycetota bacterium]|nr:hypothetical protein [Planctomycetota bacterium]